MSRSDDKAIWGRVARTVTPRRRPHGKGASKPLPSTDPTREDFANMLRIRPTPNAAKPAATGPLDEARDKRIRRGRVQIDARIDLHDQTQDQAQKTLERAVMRAANRGHRCLLVITGKGARLDGVLRTAFPRWINAPLLRPLIASYAQAHQSHGGAGAWYVFLKR